MEFRDFLEMYVEAFESIRVAKFAENIYNQKRVFDFINKTADSGAKGIGLNMLGYARDIFIEGHLKGWSRNQFMGQLKERFPKAKEHLLRAGLETAQSAIYNMGRAATIKASNRNVIRAVQFRAVVDGRTTPICRSLNGRVWNIEDEWEKFIPPCHWRCRSSIYPVSKYNASTLARMEYVEETFTRLQNWKDSSGKQQDLTQGGFLGAEKGLLIPEVPEYRQVDEADLNFVKEAMLDKGYAEVQKELLGYRETLLDAAGSKASPKKIRKITESFLKKYSEKIKESQNRNLPDNILGIIKRIFRAFSPTVQSEQT